MERGNHVHSIDVVKPATKLGNGRGGLHDGLRRECPEAADDLGTDRRELPAKERIARTDFVRFGVAVVWRPALQHVADVDIFAFEIDGLDNLGQQLSRPSDERQALLVFVKTRRFTHKHEFSVRIPGAEHDMGAFRRQLAALAITDVVPNRLQRGGVAGFIARSVLTVAGSCFIAGAAMSKVVIPISRKNSSC